MDNNEVLRSLHRLLEADAERMAAIAALAGAAQDPAAVEAMLRRADDPWRQPCEDAFLARFLDGLVLHRRGADDSRPPRPIEIPVTNNTVLKKLRVAFDLRDEHMHEIFASADIALSKGELNALFRKPDNKHFRPCSDELLEAFLEGLAMTGFGGAEEGST